MNITLPAELSKYIDEKIKSGNYNSADDMVANALRNLREREKLMSDIGLSSVPLQNVGAERITGAINPEGDISSMVMIVMMQAAKEANDEIRELMEEMKARLEAKKKMRELITKVKKDISANAAARNKNSRLSFNKEGLGDAKLYRRLPIPFPDTETKGGVQIVETDLLGTDLVEFDQLVDIQEELKNRLDSLSEMSEMQSLRLQMVMDRRSEFLQILSNIMKKISETASSIAQNIR